MGRWAKSHDQRKGQWLYNALRPVDDGRLHTITEVSRLEYEASITNKLFNMTNEEFDKIMENYSK